jgi:thiaminase
VFADYVAGLEVAADRAGPVDADAVFLEVVAAEIAFWEMAVDGR